jgi:Cu(I)/Ag(I) efflux system membrane fusion protein
MNDNNRPAHGGGTRLKSVAVAVLLLAVVAAGGIGVYWGLGLGHQPATTQAGDGHDHGAPTIWTCSMHPEIRMPKPGLCPKCGMKLIPLKVSSGEEMTSMRELTVSDSAAALMDIETSAVQRLYPKAEVRMVGKVDYDETRLSYITAWMPGRLDRLFVDYTGIAVRKGDHMVDIYSPALFSAQEELLQAVKSAKESAVAPVQGSTVFGDSSKENLAAARRKLHLLGLTDEQIARVEKLGKAEDHVIIYAPTSGIVINKGAQEGMYVETGTRIYTLADLSKVWVKLDAYESDLGWLRYGQKVEFTTVSYPGEAFTGTIAFIDPIVNPMTRTVQVRVNVPNDQGKLKPEMFVKAVVLSRVAAGGRVMEPDLVGKWICPMHPEVVKDAAGKCDICGMDLVTAESLGYVPAGADEKDKPLVIPISAALITGTRAIVYVKTPGAKKPTFQGREVVLGPRAGDWYIVRRGLDEGEQVVTRGNFKIDSSLQIEARPSMMTPDGGGSPAGEAVKLPLMLAEQFSKVLQAAIQAQEAAAADDLPAGKAAFGRLGAALAAVDANSADQHVKMAWKELAMRLGNDAFEGAAATTHAELRNTATSLAANAATLATWFGLSAAKAPTAAEAIPAELSKQFDAVFDAYFAAAAALADDDPNAARKALADMAAAVAKVDMKLFSPAGHEAWMNGKAVLDKALAKAQEAKDAQLMRVPFAPLSNAVAAMARRWPPEGPKVYYRIHCPMAFDNRGADWLAPTRDVRNPYFGASMINCGSVEETFTRKDSMPPTTAPAAQPK